MKKAKPQEIYEEALKERAKPDPLKKRQSCEKGWLAVTEAVDQFLKTHHNIHIPTGTPEAHGKRNKALADLVGIAPEAEPLSEKVAEIAEKLHGTCFYLGEDSPHFDTVLKKKVREILELTGSWNGQDK